MGDIELKPCPFCGGEAVVHVNDGVRAVCRDCGASSKGLVDGYSQGRPNGRGTGIRLRATGRITLKNCLAGTPGRRQGSGCAGRPMPLRGYPSRQGA